MPEWDYDVVAAPAVFTVVTAIAYADEPEYRRYVVDSEELPVFLDAMRNDAHAEQVVTVEAGDVEVLADA